MTNLTGQDQVETELLYLWSDLGLDANYPDRSKAPLVPQVDLSLLRVFNLDNEGRVVALTEQAGLALREMTLKAKSEGIDFFAFSGFRSYRYQHSVLKRKLDKGIKLDVALQSVIAPGFSEHHSGKAVDISSAGYPLAETSFQESTAFSWLKEKAKDFGFHMSYPEGNQFGIVYEPWHWCYQA